MKYNIRKNWIDTIGAMKKNPFLLAPFVFIAFLEFGALEKICFFSRKPLLTFMGPIIRKFFGEGALHYPGSVFVTPQLFYYADVAIYILISIALMSISINILKNMRMGLPIKGKALARNALKRYISFILFGILMMLIMTAAKRADLFIFKKVFGLAMNRLPYKIFINAYMVLLPLSLFVINLFIQIFLILTVPVMVIQNKPLFKALWKSVSFGFRNFFTIFGLIFLPFLIYLPTMFLKNIATDLSAKTFPELTILITGAGIIISVFIDSFMILCASQLIMDVEKPVD